MDALNFLYEKPTLSWFDFYLEPSKLQAHIESESCDPSVETLIAQFCDQAKSEETFIAQTDLPLDEIEYHKAKCKKLWVLVLKVCAYCKWNVVTLRKRVSLVNLKRIIEELCAVTWDTNSLAFVLTSTLNDVQPGLRFAALFTARWVLDAYVNNNFPQPPPKITVSNPAAQVDPSQLFLEAKNICLATIKCVCDSAVKILETSLDKSVTDYCTISPECFEIPNEGSGDVYLDWTKLKNEPLEVALLQIKYDLGIYYFFISEYDTAKSLFSECFRSLESKKFGDNNGHWTLDENVLKGYCAALNLQTSNSNTNPIISSLFSSKLPPTEQTAAVLLDTNRQNCPSLVLRSTLEEMASVETFPTILAQILSANLLKQTHDLFGINESWMDFFSKPENVAMFCLALKKHSTNLTKNYEKTIIRVYLKFLCECLPNLRDSLIGCGLQEFLYSSTDSTTPMDVNITMPNLSLLQNLDGMWLILNTFEPTELKQVVARIQTRTSSHYFVPSSIQSYLNRFPNGPALDLIVIAVCKAHQLAAVGNITHVSPLIDLVVQEYRMCTNETAPLDIIQEGVRLELIRWHDLAHRCSNVHRIGAFTQDLATKVKNFVVEAKKPNSPAPNWEMSLYSAAFLINTCDWEYILYQCQPFRNRFMDFSKFLAVLCYELSKNGTSLRTLAKEFFDIILPTMLESGARNQILGRSQFTLMLKLIKEQTAISVLLSFFGKLFNCKQGGLFEIFIEHSQIWPSTYADASNVSESYLKEVLSILFENGLIVNPNNAFWLRTMGDVRLAAEEFAFSIQYYLQCLAVCSDYFTKPLPDNIVDDRLIANLIRCCGRLECHTAEALLCQFVEQPNYNAAIKALQEATNYDGIDAYFSFVWDVTLLEFVIANANFQDKPNQQGRVEEAIRVLNQQEINMHNSPTVLLNVVKKRKADFLSALCSIFL